MSKKTWKAPESESERKVINEMVTKTGYELYKQKITIEDKIDDLANGMKDSFQMPKPLFKAMVKGYYDFTIEEKKEKNNEFANACDAILGKME